MGNLNAFRAFAIFFVILIVSFLLLFIFDTFIYEPLFSITYIRTSIPDALYWLMSASVSFGLPIVIFGRAFIEAIGVD